MANRLAKELRDIRAVKGFSLREVEKRTGISNAYLSQLERAEAENPAPDKLHKLAQFYGVPYVDLMKAAGYLRESTEKTKSKDASPLQVALMSANLTDEEQQQVLQYIKFLKSQK
jgi:HTH-type transcriptional regulator, competence development regulator